MIDQVLEAVKKQRGDGQDLRRRARAAEDPKDRNRLFDSARDEFQKAIDALERTLRMVRRSEVNYTNDVCRLIEALSQTYGSLGGTLRDAGRFKDAIRMYDKGNTFEEERREHCVRNDTYNMLQRLIVRILDDATCLEESEFRAELDAVRIEIDGQVENGRSDSWALADQVLARFLCGKDSESAIGELKRRNASSAFYKSAADVIAALINEGLGKNDELGRQLNSFHQLLLRKGGGSF